MALTGRFNLRKTFSGRITLQVEEEVRTFWSYFTGKRTMRRRWRDARVMDLATPELRSLVDLRFRPQYMTPTYEAPPAWPKASRQLEAVPHKTLYYEHDDDRTMPTAH